MTALRYFHETRLEPGINKLLYLLMVLINSFFEKEGQSKEGFKRILSKMFILTCQFWAELNV